MQLEIQFLHDFAFSLYLPLMTSLLSGCSRGQIRGRRLAGDQNQSGGGRGGPAGGFANSSNLATASTRGYSEGNNTTLRRCCS